MSLEGMDPSAVAELAALSKRLSDDPKTRKAFLKLAKQASPDLVLPELEIEEAVNAQLQTRDEQISALSKQLADRQVEEDLERQRDALRKRGADPDEIEAIEKLMVEKGIADHATAADYFVWQKQADEAIKAAESAQAPKPIVSQFESFFKNPIQSARSEAYKVLQESRRPTRPAGL